MAKGARADDQIGVGSSKTGQEGRDFGGIVLAVGIEGEHRLVSIIERPAHAGAQRSALALVRYLAQHRCAGCLSHAGRLVLRSVVYHQHRKQRLCAFDDRCDALCLVVSRNQS